MSGTEVETLGELSLSGFNGGRVLRLVPNGVVVNAVKRREMSNQGERGLDDEEFVIIAKCTRRNNQEKSSPFLQTQSRVQFGQAVMI
jgi:hypothetical protein